jgi:hypothetical protein
MTVPVSARRNIAMIQKAFLPGRNVAGVRLRELPHNFI